jgi:hypothetical protein
MKKPVKVEFHKSAIVQRYYWHTKTLPQVNGSRGFNSIQQATASFWKFCSAIDARGPFEFVGNTKEEAHKLLTK